MNPMYAPQDEQRRGFMGCVWRKKIESWDWKCSAYGQTLFTVTENGYGKRTSIDEYPVQKRGGKGVITIKTSERNGQVIGILLVDDEDDIMLIANSGKLFGWLSKIFPLSAETLRESKLISR
jgi:DNA gyrase/topoisomerase IV subunit A